VGLHFVEVWCDIFRINRMDIDLGFDGLNVERICDIISVVPERLFLQRYQPRCDVFVVSRKDSALPVGL